MKLLTLLALAATLTAGTTGRVAAQPVDAPAGTYKLDLTHASLTWRVKHLGLSLYTARFTRFDATLDIDPAKPETAKLRATVDPLSVRTDFPRASEKDWDKELAESDKWFNGKAHPGITFASTRVERTGDRTARVTGDLTLLGVKKPVTLDVRLNGALKDHPFQKGKPALGFSATGTLKRSDFGMTTLIGPVVGDEVQIAIEAELVGG